MTQLTLNIPDNKISFFMQLLKEFNYIKVEPIQPTILETHKKTVLDIKSKIKSNDWIDGDTLLDELDNLYL
jgi:hypothetical protein